VIPPLRERAADIAPLAASFCGNRATLAPDAIARLESYPWPGNIRELRNAIERAVVMSGGTIGAGDLELAGSPAVPTNLWTEVEAVERQRIVDALAAAAGNQTVAAKSLGIARTTLIRRIEHFGLARPKKRDP
jgi:DNA-binding NtrC family response regulator